ncbi:MAG: putative lipid II flippase FtsW [Cryobacterium sp.]|nr:putative lipid II flippase FtsW [Oligoflexia bacterium]
MTSKNWSISSDSVDLRENLKGIDYVLLGLVCALVLFGLIMVYSSSFIYAQERTGDGFAFIKKQLIFATLGFVALFFALRVPYRKWADWYYPVGLAAVGLLAIVLIPGVGSRVLGAQRWLKLGPISVQPSEIAKFAMILFVARQLEKKKEILHRFVPGVLSNFIVPLPAMLLLLLQPDFGSTVMITVVIFLMMFLAGVPKRYLGGIFLLGGGSAAALVLGSPYRRARLMTFLDPWQDPLGKGFQVLQSMLGVHNGSIFGVGLGNGKEKLFYLPEAHNDFIFAVIGEELGFIGVCAVILAFCFFIYRGLKIASDCWEEKQDRFGSLAATGITLALGLQGFVNMGVVLGLLPTKGLTLPFVSYGGSALVVDLFAIGILLNISKGNPCVPPSS